MCVVDKKFELLEFVFDSFYVDLQYDDILVALLLSVQIWYVLLHSDGTAGVSIIIIIKYCVRKRRLLCTQLGPNSSILSHLNSSIDNFCFILPR